MDLSFRVILLMLINNIHALNDILSSGGSSSGDGNCGIGLLANGTNNDAVLDVIAEIYTEFCKQNDPFLDDDAHQNDHYGFTAFKRPSYPIKNYLHRIDNMAQCGGVCWIMSAIFIDRLLHHQTNIYFSSWSAHRLIITSITLACKYHLDPKECWKNKHYAKIGGVKLVELNWLERNFLDGVDFNLYVSPETMQEYVCAFERRIELGERLKFEHRARLTKASKTYQTMSNMQPDKEETMEVLYEISQILNTGLTRHQLNILTDLCEMGVNPEALAKVVQQLKIKKQQQMNSSKSNSQSNSMHFRNQLNK